MGDRTTLPLLPGFVMQQPGGSRLALAVTLMGGLALYACGETTEPPLPPTVASVVVTPAAATLVSLGETVQLTASARDPSGNAIPGKTFMWSSSEESIARVNPSGVVTAMANGSATIAATSDGINGAATILVDQVARQLAFTVQPTEALAGASIAPAVEVVIQDASGNAVTAATDAVTLAIGTNPGGATLSGSMTPNAVNGVASFSKHCDR